MSWVYLIGAILFEVVGTLALRMASSAGRNKAWFLVVGTGYLAAFTMLTLVLRHGMGIGVAYGIWAASGVALVALASRVFFKEPLTKVMALGIILIAAGVLIIELGAAH